MATSAGRAVPAQFAGLPGAGRDPQADGEFIIHWRAGAHTAGGGGGVACTFLVRVRRGWEALRAFLLREEARFMVFVCSKGKREYVELIWGALDPGARLIPRDGAPPSAEMKKKRQERGKKRVLRRSFSPRMSRRSAGRPAHSSLITAAAA